MLEKKLYYATGSTFKVREIIKRGSKQPTLICYKKADVQMFFDYLEGCNKNSLSLARNEFPWKFDPSKKKFAYLHSIKDSNPLVAKYLSTKDGKTKKSILF